MKFIIIGILITNIYSQCDTLDELNCNHPMYGEGCEWIEYIENAAKGNNYGIEIESIWQITKNIQIQK